MNNTDWKYYYKLGPGGHKTESNLLYTPTVNNEGTVMCMHYRIDKQYRSNTPDELTQDLVDWFFKREVKFLKEMQHLSSTPEVYHIDYTNQKIFIEWNKETLSQIVHNLKRSIDSEIPNWKEQLVSIFKDLYLTKHYKLTLYPHCFFLDKNNNIKTFDFYAVVPHDERYIERKIIEGVIGPTSMQRFDQSTVDGKIDFQDFHRITVKTYIKDYWLDNNPFISVFDELFND